MTQPCLEDVLLFYSRHFSWFSPLVLKIRRPKKLGTTKKNETNSAAKQSAQNPDNEKHAFLAPKSKLDRMKDVKIYVDHRRWKLKDQYKHAKVNMTVEYVSEVSKKEKLTVHFVKNTTRSFMFPYRKKGSNYSTARRN